jgi:O-antigen ligase
MHRITGAAAVDASGWRVQQGPAWWLLAAGCALVGVLCLWLANLTQPAPFPLPTTVAASPLPVGAVVSMESAAFHYSPGWHIDAHGADPPEPANPWLEPAGSFTLRYTSPDLWLLLAEGDYWGYLFVTVDGAPANRLAVIPGNLNSRGEQAGYRTFYAPEAQTVDGPALRWVHVHHSTVGAEEHSPHEARVEVWRSWGQAPVRGVATMTAGLRLEPWIGVAFLVVALWLALAGWLNRTSPPAQQKDGAGQRWPEEVDAIWLWAPLAIAAFGLLLAGIGVALQQWLPAVGGVMLLGLAALVRPALWGAALLFALPFYFQFNLPLLPGRAFGLIDVGILGGVGLALYSAVRQRYPQFDIRNWLPGAQGATPAHAWRMTWQPANLILAGMVSWALIAVFAAEHGGVAVREWRTVFLAGGLFALILATTVQRNGAERSSARGWGPVGDDRWLLIAAWLAGATVVGAVALWQYAAGANLISAEGVWRVRAFYGSPNNLALYLDRTLAVALALALFSPTWRARLVWGTAALVQGAALLLTFSKGSLLLGLPALLVTLWVGGWVVLERQGRSQRLLWLMPALGLLVLVALTPFLEAERFQRLFDFNQGTGFLRLNLWRSAGQMALDHPLLGVGPDNFLYAYRTGYMLPAAWQEPNLNHPHNWPLDWWTRLGLPGLALALLCFGLMARGLWQGVRLGVQPVPSLGLIAALAAALAHGLIDASFALPDLMLVWVLMGFWASSQDRY